MRDIHTERPKAGPIPLVSPAMHCITMTALVYFRRNFGYAFLRPKSIFFACSWAFVLFVVVAWHEVELWRSYRAVCLFGTAGIALYWLHLLHTFVRDVGRQGETDHYSGRSHLLPLLEFFSIDRDKAELYLHLWIEPAAIALIGVSLRVFSERHLSTWLFIAAGSLMASEYLNFWSGMIRREKIAKDIAKDTEAQSARMGDTNTTSTAPKATRKEPVKMKRVPNPSKSGAPPD